MAALGISIASVTLATLANPLVKCAYGKIVSIQNANEDLEKLATTIETIKGALLNAEKWEEEPAVKNWIKRVNDVLYDADDLFDEIAIDAELKKLNEVRDSPSTLNTTPTNNPFAGMIEDFRKSLDDVVKQNPLSFVDKTLQNSTTADRVAGIRNRLDESYEDARPHKILKSIHEAPILVRREIQDEEPLFVGSENVIGRDEDKKAIVKMLSNDNQQNVSVIAIVGIGGMGKTTLAQLVCEDREVTDRFGDYQWVASINKTSSNKEIIERIYQSIFRRKNDNFNINRQRDEIQGKISGKKFLLVLDDVWDESSDSWDARMGVLSRGAKGSKIIVTTRSESVALAVRASETHRLEGLSEEKSWDLFKRIAGITPEKERDSRWNDLGRQLVRKGANVPLAIRSIASLLAEKNTIEEWELLRRVELPKLGQNDENGIMPVLRLSYNHLSSNLKLCFAYCSLFPKDHKFNKDELVYLWASQGYIKTTNDSQNIEDMGHSYFMDLFRRSFFQEYVHYEYELWKMHDLIHDLAQEVATGESIMLTTSSCEITSVGARHVSVSAEYAIYDSWADSHPDLNVNKLRSFLCKCLYSFSTSLTLEKQFDNLKCLRALKLPCMGIQVVPSSIGELKHLRYLDISYNKIKTLPDDITKLVKLCTLDISWCKELEALPSQFCKLTNLRNLINRECYKLKHMPPGFEELTSLRRLDEFVVSREIDEVQKSKLDVLSGLKLTGDLKIIFKYNKGLRNRIVDETDDWDEVECWQPPVALHVLCVENYEGVRLPYWGNECTVNQASLLPKLTTLFLSNCRRVKHLPPFRHLPFLSCIQLEYLQELETIQGKEECSIALYVPAKLKTLQLWRLSNLVGWWNAAAAPASTWPPLPSLHTLSMWSCPQLNDMLLCPTLHKLILSSHNEVVIQQLLGIRNNYSPPNFIQPSSLQSVTLKLNYNLVSFPGESLTSLRYLYIGGCYKLNKVQLAPLGSNILEELTLWVCPELELWEENKRGVDWDSLTKLTTLTLDKVPSSEELPDCLRERQERGVLKIQLGIPF